MNIRFFFVRLGTKGIRFEGEMWKMGNKEIREIGYKGTRQTIPNSSPIPLCPSLFPIFPLPPYYPVPSQTQK